MSLRGLREALRETLADVRGDTAMLWQELPGEVRAGCGSACIFVLLVACDWCMGGAGTRAICHALEW